MAIAGVAPDANAAYALPFSPQESARLRRQAIELRPEAVALLDTIGLKAGESAIDLGCGPRGILDLLAGYVGPTGRVVGVDCEAQHVAMARDFARQSGLGNVEVVKADARDTGLPPGSFDLVHARALLVTIPDPESVVAEMIRLARPGGWVAAQEPDFNDLIIYPPIPAWDRLVGLLRAAFEHAGADATIGRRVPEMFRRAGIQGVTLKVYGNAYPVGHSRRLGLPDMVASLRPVIIALGLADETELTELDRAARAHLADPATVQVQHLFVVVWGRAPSRPGVA